MKRPGYLNDYDGGFGAYQNARFLGSLGEEVQNLDKMIDIYQKHIANLKRILVAGSAAGKAQAAQKLVAEEKILKDLLDKREDLLQD